MTEIEKLYVRTFSTPSGKQVLDHLRSITIERKFGQNITCDELRWWGAQSALVHYIENIVKRGNSPT